MAPNEPDTDDQEVAAMAVEALREAQRNAECSSQPVVIVINGELVRKGPEGIEVLKKLPPRHRVSLPAKWVSP